MAEKSVNQKHSKRSDHYFDANTELCQSVSRTVSKHCKLCNEHAVSHFEQYLYIQLVMKNVTTYFSVYFTNWLTDFLDPLHTANISFINTHKEEGSNIFGNVVIMNWHLHPTRWTAVRTVYIVPVSDVIFYFIYKVKYAKRENV
jgi:hypothetical protein